MKILVTGATGFVMANLVRHLAETGHDVVAADLLAPDEPMKRFLGGLRGAVTFEPLDVTDRAAVAAFIGRVKPERTVHGAAITSVPPEAERERFVGTVSVNVTGTLHVLEALRSTRGRIVVVSSGSVYGPRTDQEPIREDDEKRPEHVYPITKWAADMLARRFAEVHRLDLAVVRLASPFGPFERDTGSRPLLSPIERWATAALRGQPITIGGPRTFARDAVYAADVGSGIAAVLLADRLPHDAYNVGWGRNATSEETARTLARVVAATRVKFDEAEPFPWGYSTRGPLCIDRLCGDLGWTPRYDLESGLRAYVDWLRARG